jgi:hypothetical protein
MTRGFGRFLRQNTIALIALFFALAGTTFAAANALPRNSVGAKQLKKNAVTNVKIAKGAVTGVKVKGNSLTGTQINEATLGKVPSAATADTANTANTANAVAKTFQTGIIKAQVGQTVPVVSFGPFSASMRCTDLGSNNYQLELIIASTEDHSAASGTSSGPGDFGPATPEATRTLSTIASTTPVYFSPYSINLVAAAPSGARIDAIAAAGIHTLGAGCTISLDGWTS